MMACAATRDTVSLHALCTGGGAHANGNVMVQWIRALVADIFYLPFKIAPPLLGAQNHAA